MASKKHRIKVIIELESTDCYATPEGMIGTLYDVMEEKADTEEAIDRLGPDMKHEYMSGVRIKITDSRL